MNTTLPLPSPTEIPGRSAFGPGNVVGVILKKLGYGEMTPDCGCKAFARKMNDWGCVGCRVNVLWRGRFSRPAH